MNIWELVLDLLFPPKCTFCQDLLEQPRALMCPDCQRNMPWLVGQAAEQKVQFVSLCVSPLRYHGTVRESIHRFKFSGRRWYAKHYGVLMAQCVGDHLAGQYDLISWVPVSRRRRRKRGYDQSCLLAEEMAEYLGRDAVQTLEKFRDNPPQSGLTGKAQRRANVMGAYRVTDPELIRDKRILLTDDVVTTGETLSECARMLRMAGAKDVVCVTLARAH